MKQTATMITYVLLILSSIALSEAFTPLPALSRTHASTRLAMSGANDEAIARLQEEYRQLQSVLLQDLEEHKMKEARDISEEMFEKAADMTSLKKYEQQEKLDEATNHLERAKGDLEQAQALQEEAHGDAEWAEDEAAMVESLDAGYEDMERLRDLSVTHAAQQLEEDARDMVVEATFQELKAEAEQEDAAVLLQKLEQNERLLKVAIQELREEKSQVEAHELSHELIKHVDFVKSVRKILKTKLIDHDPTKGNVAF